jgi:hypothetical protein
MDWVTAVSSVFVLVGAALLIAAGREFIRRRAFLRSSATASGMIVALTKTRERDEFTYFPKVEFRTPSGPRLTFQSAMGSSTAAARIGDSVTVRYRLDQPQAAEIDAFMPLWGKTLVFGALGGVFLFVGAGILTRGRMSLARQAPAYEHRPGP